ncbi:MAG: PAS domain S-box protein [Dehalococcoidales bacterium]|nr:MAG: PAS domain S-box protein [Dehalococcoidales bacterium]
MNADGIQTRNELLDELKGIQQRLVQDETVEKELKQQIEKFVHLASFPELNPNPVLELDKKGNIKYMNPSTNHFFPELAALKTKHPFLKDWSEVVKDFQGINQAKTVISNVRIDSSVFERAVSWVAENQLQIYGRDITERIEADKALQLSEAWFSRTLNSIGDAVIATDERALVKLMNPIAESLTAWNEKDAIGKPIKDVFNIFNEETGKKSAIPIERIMREGVILGLANHTVLIAKDGTKRSIDDSGAPIKDGEGKIVGTIIVFRDVTEKRQLEHEMTERVKELAGLYAIAKLVERPGITLPKIYEETVKLLPRSWQYPEDTCAQLIVDGKAYKTRNYRQTEWTQCEEIRVNGIKSGTLEICYLKEKPIRDEGPFLHEERALINNISERLGRITERMRSEERVKYINLSLLAIRNINQLIAREHDIDNLLKGTCDNLVNTKSCYHSWSILLDQAMRMTTYAQCGLWDDFSPMISRVRAGNLPTCCRKALEKAEVVVMEDPESTCADCVLSHRCANGVGLAVSLKYGDKYYGLLCVSMPKEILSYEEVLSLYQEIGDDITFALHKLDLDAERKMMDEMKDSLIGMVSHELRTPLTIVTTALKTATDKRISEKDREDLLEEAASSAESLTHIIENMLELSRDQNDRLNLDKKEINLVEFIKETFDRINQEGLKHVFTLDIPSQLKPCFADSIRLGRILDNLLDNAVKYSPMGSQIKIFAWQEEERVVIGVTDYGVGITPEDQKKLFQPFDRLDQTSTRKGIGLGLVVCQRLVAAHGGHIWVESKLGEGSTFLFSLPS